MNAIEIYKQLSQPPATALRTIQAGRLKGKSDINPQWRYEAMTATFGLCGIGWKYTIDRTWTEQGAKGEVMVHAQVSVYVKDGDRWSDPITGVGGNRLIQAESSGLVTNDEGLKMAVTDAFSTALKMIGVAADIYAGRWDGSKYTEATEQNKTPKVDKLSAQTKKVPVVATEKPIMPTDKVVDLMHRIANCDSAEKLIKMANEAAAQWTLTAELKQAFKDKKQEFENLQSAPTEAQAKVAAFANAIDNKLKQD